MLSEAESTRTTTPLAADYSDWVFIAALALLPVDGTVLGLYAPFWSPISPWLFMLYAALNWRSVRSIARRQAWLLALPVALAALSMPGWIVVGFHTIAVGMSIFGVIGAVACLLSLNIAITRKHLDWRRLVRLIIIVYWVAFIVGVLQWLAIRTHVGSAQSYFEHLMLREYISGGSVWGGGRPQFLFAEPSYIGMHLFGVLLPLFWLVRNRCGDADLGRNLDRDRNLDPNFDRGHNPDLSLDRHDSHDSPNPDHTPDRQLASQLRNLIIVFAVGSLVMGAGTRIVLDSLIALVVVIVVDTTWHDIWQRVRGILELAASLVAGVVCVLLNDRLLSIAENGAEGDGSFFARIYQSLGPLSGLTEHPWTLLTGYGAGNLADAAHVGSHRAATVLNMLGMNGKAATSWYASMTPDTMWTMSAYTSFLTEYGLVGLALIIVPIVWLTVAAIREHRAPAKLTICWLLLVAYLYIQFEGYAFYAIPLFVWTMQQLDLRHKNK